MAMEKEESKLREDFCGMWTWGIALGTSETSLTRLRGSLQVRVVCKTTVRCPGQGLLPDKGGNTGDRQDPQWWWFVHCTSHSWIHSNLLQHKPDFSFAVFSQILTTVSNSVAVQPCRLSKVIPYSRFFFSGVSWPHRSCPLGQISDKCWGSSLWVCRVVSLGGVTCCR